MKNETIPPDAKRFYSKNAGLQITIVGKLGVSPTGEQIREGGRLIMFSELQLQYQGAMGPTKWGEYITNDPTEIAILEGREDVISQAAFNQEVQLAAKGVTAFVADQAVEFESLRERNRLLEELLAKAEKEKTEAAMLAETEKLKAEAKAKADAEAKAKADKKAEAQPSPEVAAATAALKK